MTEQPKDSDTIAQTLEMAFQALLAEYKAIREASLSRDQRKGLFENFMMIVLSAAVIGLPTVITQQQYLLLLAFSIIISAIAFAHHRQEQLLLQLVLYESEVLRPQLLELIHQTASPKQLPESIDALWQWQAYHLRAGKRPLILRFIRRLIFADLKSLFVLASVGFILLFIFYRGVVALTIPEYALLALASLYSASHVIILFYSAFTSKR